MESADQGGQDMRVPRIVIVVWTVQIGRHRADEIGSVLTAIGLAELDPGDLGDGVPLIRRLEGPGQQMLLADRLGGELGIDAGTAQKKELADTDSMRFRDDVVLNLEVLEQEGNRLGVVGEDAANPRRGQNHVLGTLLIEEATDSACICEIEFVAGASDESRVALAVEFAPDGAADESLVAGDVYAGGFGDGGHVGRRVIPHRRAQRHAKEQISKLPCFFTFLCDLLLNLTPAMLCSVFSVSLWFNSGR